MSIREIDVEHFKSMVEGCGKTLQWNEDWYPFLFLVKDRKVAVVGLPPVNTETEKDYAAQIIEFIIKITNPDAVCYISTGWQGSPIGDRFMDKESFDEAYRKGWIPRPSDDPDKKEVLIMTMMNKWKEVGFIMGYIKRRQDRPPTIRRWVDHSGEGDTIGGRFGDALTEGFASMDPNGNLEVLDKLKGVRKGPEET
jgi:hypothetical protein